MPITAAGIVAVACAVLVPSLTVKVREPAVVPVENASDGPLANWPADAPCATVNAAERVPSANVMDGSSPAPATAGWKANVTVPPPLETDVEASVTVRLPCCALAMVANVNWMDGAGNIG